MQPLTSASYSSRSMSIRHRMQRPLVLKSHSRYRSEAALRKADATGVAVDIGRLLRSDLAFVYFFGSFRRLSFGSLSGFVLKYFDLPVGRTTITSACWRLSGS